MDIESRIQYLIHTLRDSRKIIVISVIAAALIIVMIFLSGSYYFLFNHFEKLHQSYYEAIVRDVSSYQRLLIGMDSYREDMKKLAQTIVEYRGIVHVWFTDRYGKLIYHTDETVMGEYRARRLPTEFYESIEHSWEFEHGYPLVHRVLMQDRLTVRLSLPLYISSRENHDFIAGIDARRFLFIPYRIPRMVLFSLVYFILSFILLFLPVFILTWRQFRKAESQARRIRMQGVSQAGPPLAADLATEQPATVPAQPVQAAGGPVETMEAAPEVPEEQPSTQSLPASKVMSTEIEQDKLFINFLKQKRSLFSSQDIETDFLQAHNNALHSKGAEGSYVLYHGLGGRHLMACFVAPSGKAPEIYDVIVEIAETVRSSLKAEVTVAQLLKTYNTYSRRVKKSFEISILLIDEEKRNVEYSCSGSETTYYLKDGEDRVKELKLENPELGSLPAKEFGQQLSTADIKLAKNDIFSLPARNAASVEIGDVYLDALLREELLSQRRLAASEIGGKVLKQFESLDHAVKNSLPQTGYIVLKFL